ncbi:hypothetical protein Rhe02_20220 [Rhizocola hellebori]|uniref:Uncharacterized protein n=1 Tax=Rhizocola hellebori TaxID=1392758 RepID=A0A8J3VEW4_9ACTN|nr:hypothetical protein Rhe02_20220 [Rhizocola hellebori]
MQVTSNATSSPETHQPPVGPGAANAHAASGVSTMTAVINADTASEDGGQLSSRTNKTTTMTSTAMTIRRQVIPGC